MAENLQWSFFAKIPNGVELLTFSQEKIHLRCLNWLKIDFWLRVLHIELTFVHNLQIKPKKYSTRKYVWHHFWKGERSWQESKQSQCLRRSSRPKGSLKKLLWEILQNSQENFCNGISFWCFQNSTGGLVLIIAVSIVAKGVLANQTMNYETRTKAYVLIWARSLSY